MISFRAIPFALGLGFLVSFASVPSAFANPPSCKGEKTPSIPRTTDASADWIDRGLGSLPVGIAQTWDRIETQIDLKRRNQSRLFRLQIFSYANPNGPAPTADWRCADIASDSPWFREEGDYPAYMVRSLDGGFTSVPMSFLIKKREEIFKWEVSAEYKILPAEYTAGVDAQSSRLGKHWDAVSLQENARVPGQYRLILDRKRDVRQETDVWHTVVIYFRSLP